MTFEQSDLQKLVEKIIEFLQRYRDDPGALEAISSELRAMFQRIPIYPGIIASLLPKVVQPVTPEQLKEGLKEGSEITVVLKDDRKFICKVAHTTPDEIKLVECKQFEPPKLCGELSLPAGEVREIRLLTRGVLDKGRPTPEPRK